MLLNFKYSCYFEVRRLASSVLNIANELKGVKLKRAEPYLSEIKGLLEKMDDKDE
jgi:hypothetical protein